MSTFTTEVRMSGKILDIQRTDRFVTLGSCFSDHIGQFLKDHKFNALVNPLGIVYNPASMATLFKQISEPEFQIREEMLVYQDGLWHSWFHHGRFSRDSKVHLVNELERATAMTRQHIREASYLILTLGSAHAYRHLKTGEVVTNCHKVPNHQFEKLLLNVDEIVSLLQTAFRSLKDLNPDLRMILTVSPVRYIRDGLVENTQSKAHLIAAVHQLINEMDFCTYFPAYEIIIDELRDYRFYQPDMVHPTVQAVEYVLQKFGEYHLNEIARDQVRLVSNLRRALNHRPLYPGSEGDKQFRQQLIQRIDEIARKYPDLDFGEERLRVSQSQDA